MSDDLSGDMLAPSWPNLVNYESVIYLPRIFQVFTANLPILIAYLPDRIYSKYPVLVCYKFQRETGLRLNTSELPVHGPASLILMTKYEVQNFLDE